MEWRDIVGGAQMADDERTDSELDTLVEKIMSTLEAEDSKIYSGKAIAEFKSPVNVGSIDDADGIGIADGLCHDTMEITLKVEGERITECRFFTDGCGATIACGSMLTKVVTGKSITEAMEVKAEMLIDMLGGLPDDHLHCASLAVIALRNAIRDRSRRVAGQACGDDEE
jgi:nitrogen fixation NifU-like protein